MHFRRQRLDDFEHTSFVVELHRHAISNRQSLEQLGAVEAEKDRLLQVGHEHALSCRKIQFGERPCDLELSLGLFERDGTLGKGQGKHGPRDNDRHQSQSRVQHALLQHEPLSHESPPSGNPRDPWFHYTVCLPHPPLGDPPVLESAKSALGCHMRGYGHYGLWVLAVCIAAQACARDPIVHAPTMIRILTKESAASETSPSASAPLVSDLRILEPAVRVASRLIAAARRSDYGSRARALCWVISVYNTPTLSRSFVRPDGGIVVSTGTFRLAETESGLAAILSHELIHALAQDEIPVSPVCVSTTGQPPPLFTREEESKTDDMGLKLMADAGYDPRELLGLWERMKREQDGSRDEVLLHFTYDHRMEQIAQSLPQALRRYEHANRAPQKVLPMD